MINHDHYRVVYLIVIKSTFHTSFFAGFSWDDLKGLVIASPEVEAASISAYIKKINIYIYIYIQHT